MNIFLGTFFPEIGHTWQSNTFAADSGAIRIRSNFRGLTTPLRFANVKALIKTG